MKINTQHLKVGERMTLRQIVRAKHGCTVREAREHCSPNGNGLVAQTIGVTLLAAAFGLVFLPVMLLAVLAPLMVPIMAKSKRARWLQLLPPEHDNEPVELA